MHLRWWYSLCFKGLFKCDIIKCFKFNVHIYVKQTELNLFHTFVLSKTENSDFENIFKIGK